MHRVTIPNYHFLSVARQFRRLRQREHTRTTNHLISWLQLVDEATVERERCQWRFGVTCRIELRFKITFEIAFLTKEFIGQSLLAMSIKHQQETFQSAMATNLIAAMKNGKLVFCFVQCK